MKKTLITLAALAMASVAQAAGTTGPVWTNYSGDIVGTAPSYSSATGKYSTDGAFTAILVYDWAGLDDKGDYYTRSLTLSGNGMSLSVGLWIDGDTAHTGFWNGSTQVAGITGDTVGFVEDSGYVTTISKSNYGIAHTSGNTKLAVAVSYDGVNTFTLSALNKNMTDIASATVTIDSTLAEGEEFTSATFGTPSGALNRVLVFEDELSPAQIIHFAAGNVPEPTTATLSLLALAGLAARRRRK